MPRTPLFVIDVSLAAITAVALVLYYVAPLPEGIAVYTVALVACLGTLPVLWSAFESLRAGEWSSMDLLASVALVFSLISAEWASAAFIALMLAGARLLEEVTEHRTKASIESLLKLRPESAKVMREGSIVETPLTAIAVGDTIIIDAGERIAADAVVVRGEAAVDESTLTGESVPVDKTSGSAIFSGTLLQSGSLVARVSKTGKDTTLEKIIALIQSAGEERSEIATLGERFGKVYLIGMMVIAGGLVFFTRDLSLTLAVVLVVCADDVAIAIPLAYLNAIRVASRWGVIVKGGRHLETLGRARIFAFDKTGTLTMGTPHVVEVVSFGESEESVIRIAATASGRSEHPLAHAICKSAADRGIVCSQPEEAVVMGGRGIRAIDQGEVILVGSRHFLETEGVAFSHEVLGVLERLYKGGKTTSIIARAGVILGIVSLEDEIKPAAREALARLRALGATKLVMLTGDNVFVAARVAKEVGIDTFFANQLPSEKVEHIQALAKEGEVVMVGDGVNDAAALAAASVGVAMGAIGYDAAIESAEIVLMHDDIARLPDTIELARSVRRLAIQDFWIWGATNLVGLVLVFGGVIGAPGAAAYNFVSDFFPLANSLRIRGWKSSVARVPSVD